ncbi:MAG TPA: helix-turn-helix domain-containing protein [Armatimonadota bacterium]|nr:helix-turn-helix domain-containing protein [Armatimonadota bacterium]
MMAITLECTAAPTEGDRRLASMTSQKLDLLKPPANPVCVQILRDETDEDQDTGGGPLLSIPASAFRLLSEILREMARGNAVTVIPVQAMLSTQQAAEILNVSRPFVVSLLESGKIPYQRLGSHRRVRLSDLMAFKEKADESADRALRELAEEAQELGMGY